MAAQSRSLRHGSFLSPLCLSGIRHHWCLDYYWTGRQHIASACSTSPASPHSSSTPHILFETYPTTSPLNSSVLLSVTVLPYTTHSYVRLTSTYSLASFPIVDGLYIVVIAECCPRLTFLNSIRPTERASICRSRAHARSRFRSYFTTHLLFAIAFWCSCMDFICTLAWIFALVLSPFLLSVSVPQSLHFIQ